MMLIEGFGGIFTGVIANYGFALKKLKVYYEIHKKCCFAKDLGMTAGFEAKLIKGKALKLFGNVVILLQAWYII